MEKKNDCFGLLYDQLLTPCRDICEVRSECRQEVQRNIRQSVFASTKETSKTNSSAYLKPPISKIVSQIIELCESVGLRAHFRRYYIAIKDNKGRSLLYCSRLQTMRLNGTVRFVRLKKRESFPPEIRQSISHEKCCGQYYFTGNNLKEFERVLKIYIDRVQAMFAT